jgi:hypothetical protein
MPGRAVPSATVCPLCGHRHSHVFGVFVDAAPTPGDVSLCIRCGAVNVFDDCLALRSPTAAEWRELEQDSLAPLN